MSCAPSTLFCFMSFVVFYLDAYVSHMTVCWCEVSTVTSQTRLLWAVILPITRLSVSSLRLDIWAQAILGRWQLCGAMAVLNLSFTLISFFSIYLALLSPQWICICATFISPAGWFWRGPPLSSIDQHPVIIVRQIRQFVRVRLRPVRCYNA